MRCLMLHGLLLLIMSGCAISADHSIADDRPHSECLVCKKNADLACVDIPVDQNTPHYLFNSRTYYFCSDECRSQFIKSPEKFAGK